MITKIFNFQFSIFNSERSQKGFTLVELLASVIVLVAIGSIIAGIITTSLRGTNKANTIENIRQNGNYALNQISKDIEYAQPFDGKNTGLGNLDNDGNIIYTTSCPFSSSPTSYSLISVESTNNKRIQYKCTSSELSANGVLLIDANSVSLNSCSFSCIKNQITDIPIVKIKFELSSGNSNGLAENSGSITFETSVTMRNYKK
jgi:type II secretory pathway pseudopilin PulG